MPTYESQRRWNESAKGKAAKARYRNSPRGKAVAKVRNRRGRGLPEATRPEPTLCEACGNPPGLRSMHLDHSHKTGKFRGWLCGKCNTGFGKLGDTYEEVIRRAKYLASHADGVRGMSDEYEQNCAYPGSSTLVRMALLRRIVLFAELCLSELVDRDKLPTILDHESHERYLQQLLNELDALVRAGRWPGSGAAEQVSESGHSDHTPSATLAGVPVFLSSELQAGEWVLRTGNRPSVPSSKPVDETEPVYSNLPMSPPKHTPPSAGCPISMP